MLNLICKRSHYICVFYHVHERLPCHTMPYKHHAIKMKRKSSIASINMGLTQSTHQSNITISFLYLSPANSRAIIPSHPTTNNVINNLDSISRGIHLKPLLVFMSTGLTGAEISTESHAAKLQVNEAFHLLDMRCGMDGRSRSSWGWGSPPSTPSMGVGRRSIERRRGG